MEDIEGVLSRLGVCQCSNVEPAFFDNLDTIRSELSESDQHSKQNMEVRGEDADL